MRYLLILLFTALCLPALAAKDSDSLDDDLVYHLNFGRAQDVQLLLEKGANPNANSSEGDTMLNIAITRNDGETPSLVTLLLDKGADPNLPDKAGNYPLVLAVKNGEPKIVSMLLSKNADFHIKTQDGVALIDIAKKSGNAEVIKYIQDAFDNEAAYAASLRSPQRFKEIIRLYAFNSCAYQYWNYYLASRQNPDDDAATTQKIVDSKTILLQMVLQIQKYYPTVKQAQLQGVSTKAAQEIYDTIDGMISNRNRAENGIGKDKDMERRCKNITNATDIDFMPTDLK